MRTILVVLMLSLIPFNAFAKKIDDAEQMGHFAGIMLACKAGPLLYQYEEIMSRFFSNTSNTPDGEKAKLRMYVQSKKDTYLLYRKRKFDCAEAINEFSKMKIFQMTLYSDGSLRLPDGSFLYPRGQKKLAPNATKISFKK